ncbi:hypothetical protein KIN20_034724 [Parelaphostrongylus tenuis]|uniref:Uncharacterized protein n=1 Tax=Parelaphostrongylus tenuis TaxID=148309 RepID=A0AAD5WJY4_PARTN|nr:hypothetical protein KIN20_034724 [Parelaphostrongylus tenuis]
MNGETFLALVLTVTNRMSDFDYIWLVQRQKKCIDKRQQGDQFRHWGTVIVAFLRNQ